MKSENFRVIFSKLGYEKYKKYLLITTAIGLFFVMFSSLIPESRQKGGKTEVSYTETLSEYCAGQEERLERILSSIDGVGEVKVMMTLENGVEYRYAADEKQSGDSIFTYAEGSSIPSKVQESENAEQNYILIGSSGDRKPLVVTEISPRVKGVVVVCDGGADPVTIKRVTDAVTTALGINSLQVCVAKASK